MLLGFPNTNKAIQSARPKIAAAFRESTRAYLHKASGKLEKSFKVKTGESGLGISLIVTGFRAYDDLTEGRKPKSRIPNITNIYHWIRWRGFKDNRQQKKYKRLKPRTRKQLAFAFAIALQEKGFHERPAMKERAVTNTLEIYNAIVLPAIREDIRQNVKSSLLPLPKKQIFQL